VPKAFLGIKLDPEDKNLLEAIAKQNRITVSDLVRLLVFKGVESYRKQEGIQLVHESSDKSTILAASG
jgi:hypothetical protein